MPQLARLDAPGVLYHAAICGNECRGFIEAILIAKIISSVFQYRCRKFCHHDRVSACTLLSQVFGTPKRAMREFRMISDNIYKAPQQGIAHLPAAYLYSIAAVAFDAII